MGGTALLAYGSTAVAPPKTSAQVRLSVCLFEGEIVVDYNRHETYTYRKGEKGKVELPAVYAGAEGVQNAILPD
jgi:hypothetical protein